MTSNYQEEDESESGYPQTVLGHSVHETVCTDSTVHRRSLVDLDDDACMSDETFTPGHSQASVANADTGVQPNNQVITRDPLVHETVCTDSTVCPSKITRGSRRREHVG